VPVLGLAVPPLYNRHDPTLVGVPFFYAWQLLMIAVAAVCLLLVHRTDRRNADRQDRDR